MTLITEKWWPIWILTQIWVLDAYKVLETFYWLASKIVSEIHALTQSRKSFGVSTIIPIFMLDDYLVHSLDLNFFVLVSISFTGSWVYWWHRRLCQHSTWQPKKWTHPAPADIDHCIVCYSCQHLDSRDIRNEHPLSIVRNWRDIRNLCWEHHNSLCIAFLARSRICQMEEAAWYLKRPYYHV